MNQDQNPFEASIKDLRAIKGIDAKAAEQIRSYRDLDFGTRELAQAQKQGISVVTYWDDDYPLLLKKIYDTPVSSGAEIIREINARLFHPLQPVKKSISIKLTDQEQLILEFLGQDPVHIDALAQSVDMDITSLLEILLKLELKNAVQQIGGKQFVRA